MEGTPLAKPIGPLLDTSNLSLPELFLCEKTQMRLTRPGCARLWVAANDKDRRPREWEGKFACLACPLGARHAEKPISATAPLQEAWRMCCPRCRRLTLRIIKNRFCPSCYNRAREASSGVMANAKGSPPIKILEKLHPESVAVSDGETIKTVREAAVYDLEELIIVQARLATRPLAFGRVGHVGA
jgi:hypothetical protein